MLTGGVLTFVYFFIICASLGYGALYFSGTKKHEHWLIAALEIFAIGFALFSFLGIVLNTLHIPLHPAAYVVLAAIGPLVALIRKAPVEKRKPAKKPWKDEIVIIGVLVLITAAFLFALFYKGAMAYPYLEDDDPINHAQSVVYVGREHTYTVDPASAIQTGYAYYLEPYPPTYDVMMGVLWQLNGSVYWTLKVFNALLCALALVFAYLFAREYTSSDRKALFAVVTLAVLPSFMSHFIWSQTLAIGLFFIGWYAILRALHDRTWIAPAIIAIASAMVSQPIVSLLFGITIIMLAIILAAHELSQGKRVRDLALTWRCVIVGASGLALSMLFWGAQVLKLGLEEFLGGHGGGISSWNSGYVLQKYSLSTVVFPPHNSMIDQAVGWGLVLSVLTVLSVLLLLLTAKKTFALSKNWKYTHLALWFLLLLYIVFAPTFDLPSYGTSRAWPWLAIPLALLAAEGAFIIAASFAGKNEPLKIIIVLALLLGIVATSLPAKISVQTAQWPPGVIWAVPQVEVPGYVQMRETIPANSRVWAFCGGANRIIEFDMQGDPWDSEQEAFRSRMLNETGESILAFLDQYRYEYVTLDVTCVRDYGENATTDLAQRLTQTQRFEQVLATPGFLLARVIR